MRLWIAEKPSLAKAVADALRGSQRKTKAYIEVGDEIVTWCFGHMYELAEPVAYGEQYKAWSLDVLPIVPPPDGWKLAPRKDAQEQIDAIAALIKKASTVVHVGDPDREGQMLVDELLQELGCRKPVMRLWLSAAPSPENVRVAIAAMRSNNEPKYANLFRAAVCRSRSDWFYISISRHVTLTARNSRPVDYQGIVLTVGRVQTPTLALVVKRDLEIENFKPTAHFGVKAKVAHAAGTFEATWKIPDSTLGLDSENRLVDRSVAQAVVDRVSGKFGTVTKFDVTDKQEKAPLPFSLSKLQLAASRKYGMSAQRVLDCAQSLYETHKLTSYPRTDCQYLEENQHGNSPAILRAVAQTYGAVADLVKGADASLKSDAWDDKKLTAHHAIIPSASPGNVAALNDDERKVYDLIVRSYIAQFYPPYKFKSISVAVSIAGETFTANGAVPVSPGWKAVDGKSASEDDSDDVDELLQTIPRSIVKGDAVRADSARVNDMVTKPPARFTQGTLIEAMSQVHKFESDPKLKALLKENSGIGTEATRAGILENLLKREYLVNQKKYIVSTELGRSFIGVLSKVMPEVTSPGLTGLVEQKLSEIVDGSYDERLFMEKQEAFIRSLIAKSRNASFPPVPEGLRASRAPGPKSGGARGAKAGGVRAGGKRGAGARSKSSGTKRGGA